MTGHILGRPAGVTRRLARAVAATAAMALVGILAAVPAAPAMAKAPQYVQINGGGSTWSGRAIDQWRREILVRKGINVSYAQSGSTTGRSTFAEATVDFGVSEIPYGTKDSFQTPDFAPSRRYAYMPIVAGGTSFMYNLKIGGRRVTNLRLSGEVIAKIFTGVIKRWNDPAIRADNPGLNLPARAIVPVIRQDSSGTSAQFTLWMSKQYPAIWNAYCRKWGKPLPCSPTSSYPMNASEGFIGQSLSQGVAGYVSQSNAEGAITYVEYSYAKDARFPVAKVLNEAGYYVEPTASNVAVALTKAEINPTPGPDFLTQILTNVYRFNDPRTYPLSSYSYMILPVDEIQLNMNENKGYTLAEFAYYFLCEGQQQAEDLGYSPLPKNLVDAAIKQVHRIPGGVDRNIDVVGCNNPTFDRNGVNTLLSKAPQPSPCDRRGPTQNPAGTAGARDETPVVAAAACRAGAGSGPATPGATGGPAVSAGPSASAGPVDPDTGTAPDTDANANAGDGGGEQVLAVPVSLDDGGGWRLRHTMMLLAGVLLVGLVVGPPLLSNTLRRGRGSDPWSDR